MESLFGGAVVGINGEKIVTLFVRDATAGDRLLLSAVTFQFVSLTVSTFVFEQQFDNEISVQTVARNIGIVREFLFFTLLGVSVYLAGDSSYLKRSVLFALVAQYVVVCVAIEVINGGKITDTWQLDSLLGFKSTLSRLAVFIAREVARAFSHADPYKLQQQTVLIFVLYATFGTLAAWWGVGGVMTRTERAMDTGVRVFIELPCAAIAPYVGKRRKQ